MTIAPTRHPEAIEPTKRRLHGLLAAALILVAAGCSTVPTKTPPPAAQYDPDKPQTRLLGAKLADAKSVAMGAAVTKGWKIADSTGNRLLLQRPLEVAAADPPGGGAAAGTGKPPLMEVEAGFFQRPDGVDVVLDANVITAPGTENETRRDYTEPRRKDLMHSLASLQQAWSVTGAQVANATPPLQSPSDLGAPPTAEEAQEIASTEGPGQFGPTDWSSPPTPQAPATAASNQPVTEDADSATVSPAPVVDRGNAGDAQSQIQPPPQGTWSYYAERYARTHGCSLTDQGAVLVEKRPEYEIQRVPCTDGRTFLLRCNAGTCEETGPSGPGG